jgi:hypothetical protein
MSNFREGYKGMYQPSFGKYVGTERELNSLAKQAGLERMSAKEAFQEAHHKRKGIEADNRHRLEQKAESILNHVAQNFDSVRTEDGRIIKFE